MGVSGWIRTKSYLEGFEDYWEYFGLLRSSCIGAGADVCGIEETLRLAKLGGFES